MVFSLNTNITDNLTSSTIIEQAVLLIQDYLTHFALRENFLEEIELAFGYRFNPTKLENYGSSGHLVTLKHCLTLKFVQQQK